MNAALKKSISVTSLALFLMLSISIHAGGVVEAGRFKLTKQTDGFNLHENEGSRSFTVEVRFAKKFTKKPEILLSVTALDANTKGNVRYEVEPSFVSTEGFILKVSTSGDSKIYGLDGQWMAIEPE